MAKAKTQRERLFGAAVLKVSSTLRGAHESPAYKSIYPGVLRDLGVTDEEVDAYVESNREEVERAAKGTPEIPPQ